MCNFTLNSQKLNILSVLKYLTQLIIASPMVKIIHVRRLEVVCKNHLMLVRCQKLNLYT